MDLVAKAREYYSKEDMNCAESLIRAANDTLNLNISTEDIKMAGGFGGGMFVDSACGAVCGSVMAIAKIYNTTQAHKCPDLKINIRRLMSNIDNELHSHTCLELKPIFYTKEEKCLQTVTKIAEILEKTLKEINDI